MLLKILSFDTAMTETAYRRHRTGLLWVWAGLMLAGVLTMLFAAFGVPLLVADPERVDFCMGMYTGIGLALLVIAVLQFIRCWQMLHDDKKLHAAYIKDTDERRREISSRAVYAAGMTMVAALYVALLIAGLFWPEVFWFCYAMVMSFVVLILGFHFYYEHKL